MSSAAEPVSFAELSRAGTLAVGDGYRAKLNELGGTGPIFLRAGKLSSAGIDWTEPERFLDELADRVASKMSRPGDTVITTKGNSVGRCGYVQPGSPAFVYSPHLSFWRSLDHSRLDPGFLRYWAQGPEFRSQLNAMAHGTDMAPYLSLVDQQRLMVTLPDVGMQVVIAATLGALDDKIESNRRTCQLLRDLGQALVAAADMPHTARLRELTRSISRGVTPKYADDDQHSPIVINQKCIRDGRVSLAPARRMVDRQVAQQKRVSSGDVLVNSTGTGTLGRVGRWHDGEVFADSHVSIVKADDSKIGPTVLAYLMFAREVDIEGMATGSTGQTELSPTRLGDLVLDVPTQIAGKSLEAILLNFESRAAAAEAEIATLIWLRDTLLPELLSGRIRVPKAADAVEACA